MSASGILLLAFGAMFGAWMWAERKRAREQDEELDRLHAELVEAEQRLEIARELMQRGEGREETEE